MKMQFLVISVVGALAACSTDGIPRKKTFYSDVCEAEVIGYTRTKIRYGDSYLEVKPVSKLWPGTEFQVELQPRRARDGEPMVGGTVEVKGNEDDEGAGWIDGTSADEKDDPHGIIIAVGCAPENPGEEYKFDVIVEGVGVLDPRARVIPR